MDTSKFNQVPKELVNDLEIKASLYDQMTSNLGVVPKFYWKKFVVWKKIFKKYNPSLNSYTKSERVKIYKEMFEGFCREKT